ncbi:MAG: glycosyltransferase [Cytophagaceae bacterium]|nr:glycosyltransferase [Cytophagaceae bacterium]MDW8456911.1 glycosyltransferase [Cytophagaceae bacterium]
MKKLKILHTTTRLVRGGGVENNIYHSISQLHEEYEFHLACGADFQENPFEHFDDVKVIICPYLINKIDPIRDLQALWFFYRLIRKEKYDIVHTHETKASFITKLAAWLAHCPYIIYGLHGVTFNDPMSKLKRKFYIWLEKITIGVSDCIVAVGNDTIHHYHKNNIGKNIPYYIVRSGMDVESFVSKQLNSEEKKNELKRRLSISHDDFVLINVGRFSFSKAQRYTIQCFAEVKKEIPQAKLLLIGEGELLEECKRLAHTLHISHDVIFVGYSSDVAGYLSISDVFVFTSLREGLPRVIVEAALMKVPVAAFDVEGIKEIIEHEKSGYIVAQYDVRALTFYVKKLLKEADTRKKFSEIAFHHVKAEWDCKQMAMKLRDIYTQAQRQIK